LQCSLRTRIQKVTTTSAKVFRHIYRLGYKQLFCYSRLFCCQRWKGLGMKLATHMYRSWVKGWICTLWFMPSWPAQGWLYLH